MNKISDFNIKILFQNGKIILNPVGEEFQIRFSEVNTFPRNKERNSDARSFLTLSDYNKQCSITNGN